MVGVYDYRYDVFEPTIYTTTERAMSEAKTPLELSCHNVGKQRSNVVSLSGRKKRHTPHWQEKTNKKKKILVVGADNTTYRIVREFASHKNAVTSPTNTSDEALDGLESIDYSVVVMVHYPPKVDAISVIKLFKFINPHSECKFLVLHDDPDWDLIVRVNDVAVDAHILMPFDPLDLKKLMNSLLE